MRILTYGTFDLLHEGHLRLLHRASKLGKLYVGVSTDDFCRVKGKTPIISDWIRFCSVQALPFVEKTLYEYSFEQKREDIDRYNIDLLVMGDDWAGKFDHLGVETLYFPRTPGTSTSYLKEIFNSE